MAAGSPAGRQPRSRTPGDRIHDPHAVPGCDERVQRLCAARGSGQGAGAASGPAALVIGLRRIVDFPLEAGHLP
jgi:hypothetical protein